MGLGVLVVEVCCGLGCVGGGRCAVDLGVLVVEVCCGLGCVGGGGVLWAQ